MEIKKPDAEFDLTTISDMEIFEGIKKGIVKTLNTLKGYEKIQNKDVQLNADYYNRRMAFGEDKNLYPHIVMDLSVKNGSYYDSFDLFIDTFNIKLAPHKFDPQMIENANLTNAFIKFMITRFPKSNYLEKREEYFKKAKINQRIRDELLIF